MKSMLYVLILLLVVGNLGFINCTYEGYLNRVVKATNNGFSITEDTFNNPRADQPFCQSRNGICTNGNTDRCEECKCKINETFISYQHGCMNKQQSDNFLKGSICLQHAVSRYSIPASTPLTFQSYPQLINSPNINSSLPCTIDYITSLSPVDGSKTNVTKKYVKFAVYSGKLYLGCINDADCSLPQAQLYKMHVRCRSLQGNTDVASCFIFKTYGQQTFSLSTITDPIITTPPIVKTTTAVATTTASTTVPTTPTTTIGSTDTTALSNETTINTTISTTTATTAGSVTTNFKNATTTPPTTSTFPTRTTKPTTVSTTNTSSTTSNKILKERPQTNFIKENPAVIGGMAGVIFLIIVLIGFVSWRRRNQKKSESNTKVTYSTNNVTVNKSYIEDNIYDSGLYESASTPTDKGATRNSAVMVNQLYDACNTYSEADNAQGATRNSAVMVNQLYDACNTHSEADNAQDISIFMTNSSPTTVTYQGLKESLNYNVTHNEISAETGDGGTELYAIVDQERNNDSNNAKKTCDNNIYYASQAQQNYLENSIYDANLNAKNGNFTHGSFQYETGSMENPIYG